jgi:O-antigen/teichoic acid export membrane protein
MFEKKDPLVAYPLWHFTTEYLKRRFLFASTMAGVVLTLLLARYFGWETVATGYVLVLSLVIVIFIITGKKLIKRFFEVFDSLFQ